MDEHTRFTEDALKALDGHKAPLTDKPGGKVIGEATLYYHHATGELKANFRVDDPEMAKLIKGDVPSVIFRKES